MTKTCVICNAEAYFFYQKEASLPMYYKCEHCYCVFEDERYYLSAKAEKERYDAHENDVEDLRYQEFVSPIVKQVKKHFDQQSIGLDFGAGSAPVITKLLEDKGYQLDGYDPYYFPRNDLQENYYDYIVCCETMEHFHFPINEFKWMKKLLKNGGFFFGKTKMIDEQTDFHRFNYKNDQTHVVFYSEKTLQKIKDIIGFKDFYLSDNTIIFTK